MSEQRRASFAAFVAIIGGVVSVKMGDDIAWAACLVTWAIFTATALIIGAIDRRER